MDLPKSELRMIEVDALLLPLVDSTSVPKPLSDPFGYSLRLTC